MNELSLDEFKRLKQKELLEKERELWMLKIEQTGKKLLWFFSGVLSALVVVYAISISMF